MTTSTSENADQEHEPVGLADPLTLACGQVLPNRIMKSALSEGLGTADHGPDMRVERLYSRWGTGGYGLVVTGNVMVDSQHLGEPGNIVVEDDRHLDGLTRWAKYTKDGGTPIWMQLNHPGRQANPIATREQPVAPSVVTSKVATMVTPRALSDGEIRNIIGRFATSAAVAEAAGFDGVQIHGAHGYLVSQFLSPRTNHRTDRWGGSTEARTTFVLEVVAAIRAAVSPGFAVGIKLNSADFQRGGFDENESRATVEKLARSGGLDQIEISGGSYESPAMMGRFTSPVSDSTRRREAYFLEYARMVREAAGSIPLAVTGGFRTREGMNDAVASGDCDVVGIGRPSTVSPDAAARIIGGAARLEVPPVSLHVPKRISTHGAWRSVDGAIDLQWHTDQLHRLAAGKEPDPARSPWRTLVTTVRRNGVDAFRSRRAGSSEVDR
ncbi:MAG: NADH:flavin oxidoreductase/NADH oxidase family protein [Rhodococcus sp. (in: high G+C Gram-positive bacteria)]